MAAPAEPSLTAALLTQSLAADRTLRAGGLSSRIEDGCLPARVPAPGGEMVGASVPMFIVGDILGRQCSSMATFLESFELVGCRSVQAVALLHQSLLFALLEAAYVQARYAVLWGGSHAREMVHPNVAPLTFGGESVEACIVVALIPTSESPPATWFLAPAALSVAVVPLAANSSAAVLIVEARTTRAAAPLVLASVGPYTLLALPWSDEVTPLDGDDESDAGDDALEENVEGDARVLGG
jgi:hypothetical protein